MCVPLQEELILGAVSRVEEIPGHAVGRRRCSRPSGKMQKGREGNGKRRLRHGPRAGKGGPREGEKKGLWKRRVTEDFPGWSRVVRRGMWIPWKK